MLLHSLTVSRRPLPCVQQLGLDQPPRVEHANAGRPVRPATANGPAVVGPDGPGSAPVNGFGIAPVIEEFNPLFCACSG